MGDSFGRNFLAGYATAQTAQRAREREEMERQQLALERQRTQSQLKIADETAKAQEIERQQQDALQHLEFLKQQDAPTTPVSPEAGGVGPPAPGPREEVTFPTHAGGRLSTPARYRNEIQQDALNFEEQKGQVALGLKQQGRQQEQGMALALGPRARRVLGVPDEAQLTDDDVKILMDEYKEKSANHRAAMAAAAAREKTTAGQNKWTPATDEMGNFTGQSYNANTGEVRELPGLAGLRGKPLSGYAASRIHQAHVINDAGEQLIEGIQDVAPKLGPLKGRVFDLEKMIGNPDPDIAQFAAELESFVALQPALHGFRGSDALREFGKLIGGTKQTPESLAAGIKGILRTSTIVSNSGKLKAPASDSAKRRRVYDPATGTFKEAQ